MVRGYAVNSFHISQVAFCSACDHAGKRATSPKTFHISMLGMTHVSLRRFGLPAFGDPEIIHSMSLLCAQPGAFELASLGGCQAVGIEIRDKTHCGP